MAKHMRPDGSIWYDHGNSDPEHPDVIYNSLRKAEEKNFLSSFNKINLQSNSPINGRSQKKSTISEKNLQPTSFAGALTQFFFSISVLFMMFYGLYRLLH